MVRYVDLVSDTICAPVTAQGHAGVAVIRVSGDKAWGMTKQFIKTRSQKPRSHQVFLASFKNLKGENLDQVLVTYFEKGRSFSGDETVEIACHGNPLIVNAISEMYLNKGCRMAEPGEFSFRAFYNGKIDLVQAESIQKLVTNNSFKASNISLNHLTGKTSLAFKALEEKIVRVISHLEAQIDFVEQDVEPDENIKLMELVDEILNITEQLLSSHEYGKNIQKGHRILICGPTNVGKSSLFNKLFNEERVIVTSQAGTTRDLIEGQSFLGSHLVEFVDSAGLRETCDPVEKIGIEKTFKAIEDSFLILCVVDKLGDLSKDFVKKLPLDQCFLVFNKIDLLIKTENLTRNSGKPFVGDTDKYSLKKLLDEIISMKTGFEKEKIFLVSALEDLYLESLKERITNFIDIRNSNTEENMIIQARHFDHLIRLKKNLKKTMKFLKQAESPDLISHEMRMGLSEIHSLLGKEYNDEVLDKIFGEFCIGK